MAKIPDGVRETMGINDNDIEVCVLDHKIIENTKSADKIKKRRQSQSRVDNYNEVKTIVSTTIDEGMGIKAQNGGILQFRQREDDGRGAM